MTLYATCEAALLTLVRAVNSGATYDATNSSRGDWSVRDRQGVTLSAVLYQARASQFAFAFPGGRGAHGRRQERHFIGVQVAYARGAAQGGDGVAYAGLQTAVDSLIAHLNQYPRLNGTSGVKEARVSEAGMPVYNAGRTHLIRALLVEVAAEIDLVQVESAQ